MPLWPVLWTLQAWTEVVAVVLEIYCYTTGTRDNRLWKLDHNLSKKIVQTLFSTKRNISTPNSWYGNSLSILNPFSKYFQRQTHQLTYSSTTPRTCRYTTWWNINVIKPATVYNEYHDYYAFSALELLVGRQEECRSVKVERWGVCVLICLERGTDCSHMVKLMLWPSQNPLISCLIKIQTGFYFLVPAYPGVAAVVVSQLPINHTVV